MSVSLGASTRKTRRGGVLGIARYSYYFSYHSRLFLILHNHVHLVSHKFFICLNFLRRECRYYFCYTYTNYLVVTSYLLAAKTPTMITYDN